MATPKTSVLFLCTGNSARSIMAEAIANQQFGKYMTACSAGSSPKGEPNPKALEMLTKNGLSTEGLASKGWNAFVNQPFDLVVTLCDAARDEPCPAFPGAPKSVHWSLPDPPAADQPDSMFEAVYDALVEAIGCLAHAPDPDVAGRGREAARVVSHRFSPRAV